MNTCADCIHFGICPYGEFSGAPLPVCKSFKDKSKFIELPCRPGDTLYDTRTNYSGVRTDAIRPFEVCKVDFVIVPWETWYVRDVRSYEFGKDVFLTKEEAEKKLKEKLYD